MQTPVIIKSLVANVWNDSCNQVCDVTNNALYSICSLLNSMSYCPLARRGQSSLSFSLKMSLEYTLLV